MTRRQSNNQWSDGIAATTPQKIPSAKIRWKNFAPNSWDHDGILLIDYLPKGQTMNAENYSSLLVQLKDILNKKRCVNFTKAVTYYHLRMNLIYFI
jgi:hypothetical protein